MIMKYMFCTWVMSLVDRVINDAVEKLSNSALANDWTFLNKSLRMSLAIAVEMRAARSPTEIVQIMDNIVSKSIKPPTPMIQLVWILSVFMPSALYSHWIGTDAAWTSKPGPSAVKFLPMADVICATSVALVLSMLKI